MSEVLVGQAVTNPTPNSITTVKVNEYICVLKIEKNSFGDFLPIIPSAARTQRNKVLYQLKLRAVVTRHIGGKPVSDYNLKIQSSRNSDQIEVNGKTNKDGETTLTLSTRDAGELELITNTAGITMANFAVKLNEAWYESPFLITGYNICKEDDFSNELVDGNGLNEKHKDDFLYSATGVAMQGTGIATDGKYIRIVNKPGWKKNNKGNPERLENPSSAIFAYATGFHGKFADITEGHSIAVDVHVIPKKGKVEIDGVGLRIADDTGGGIKLYHIDNFLGSGKMVVKAWLKGGVKRNKSTRKISWSKRMKIPPYIFSLILLTTFTNVEAETLRQVYLDEKNNVHVITALGQDLQITKTGDASSLKLASNNETVAWLVMNTWIAEGDNQPQSEELKIYENKQTKSIKCSLFIRDFWFWLDGKQIAIDCGGRHFAGWEFLYDTKSLKKIASFDQDEIPLEKRPDWSRGEE
jgi:3D (Asp-Asp-Asp) domain-containing protein